MKALLGWRCWSQEQDRFFEDKFDKIYWPNGWQRSIQQWILNVWAYISYSENRGRNTAHSRTGRFVSISPFCFIHSPALQAGYQLTTLEMRGEGCCREVKGLAVCGPGFAEVFPSQNLGLEPSSIREPPPPKTQLWTVALKNGNSIVIFLTVKVISIHYFLKRMSEVMEKYKEVKSPHFYSSHYLMCIHISSAHTPPAPHSP